MSSSADNAVMCSEDTSVAKNLIAPKEEKDISDEVRINYKDKYRSLKRKLSSLLYEQECFHEELRKVQKKCLRASRDKSFLLDRLLQYEKPSISSSDDELTDSSVEEKEEVQEKKEIIKTKSKKKNSSQRSSEKPIINSSEKSTNKSSEKFKKKSSCVNDVEKERCRHTENGKQCTKLVSTKIKSGICFIHRQQMVDNNISQKKPSVKRAYPPTGGKDIGQIREAMEASSRLGTSTEEEDDELVIDLP